MKFSAAVVLSASVAIGMVCAGQTQAALQYDQNVTPGVIMGSGIGNGSFTVDRASGVELGLRGKTRYNASGVPDGTYNSNGDGTYTFEAGVAPTQSFPTAVWSFEWSINSNYDGTGVNLAGLTYELGVDSDPSAATSFTAFDLINGINGNTGTVYWDHSIGDNSTDQSTDHIAVDEADYASLISTYNVAQNSWKAHWFLAGFDPTVNGVYDFYLSASDPSGEVARTEMQIIVVPEPAALSLMGLGGLAMLRRR